MPNKTLDYLSIFKKLNEKRIRYIVVGGIAVNLHGVPRMTYDIDLLLDLEKKNIEKFLHLLKEWGFKPKAPVNIMDLTDKNNREDWIKNKNMKAFNLVNPKGVLSEIDVIIDSPIDYEKGHKNTKTIILNGVHIPVIAIDDLIAMKQVTGRQQDEADIRYLRKHKNEKI